jgi:hypothetical protein
MVVPGCGIEMTRDRPRGVDIYHLHFICFGWVHTLSAVLPLPKTSSTYQKHDLQLGQSRWGLVHYVID